MLYIKSWTKITIQFRRMITFLTALEKKGLINIKSPTTVAKLN